MYSVYAGKEKLNDTGRDSWLLDEIKPSILIDSVLDEIPVQVATKLGTGKSTSATRPLRGEFMTNFKTHS